MNRAIIASPVTEQEFRTTPALRDALAAFLESDAGAHLLYLLRRRNLPKRPELALPEDKLEQLDAAARRESIGWERCIGMIEALSELPAEKPKKPQPKPLGIYEESELEALKR